MGVASRLFPSVGLPSLHEGVVGSLNWHPHFMTPSRGRRSLRRGTGLTFLRTDSESFSDAAR